MDAEMAAALDLVKPRTGMIGISDQPLNACEFRQERQESARIELSEQHAGCKPLTLIRSKLELQPFLIAHEAVMPRAVRKFGSHGAQQILIQKIVKDNVRKRVINRIARGQCLPGLLALIMIEAAISANIVELEYRHCYL
ncbi:hypothetical protein [Sphingomonas sp. C3-2]|uniref:hypothetical protein n=1 Tax=Sphingomonas sp. C3-2 TaxID=3062169 RepID=UPI00294B462D|nr:hypothetical protein [Sphingomonas sp. C3-2]WOK38356.1 hypothetical protein QYC26_16530 [Sphingomonas sp. C3-2]